MLLPILFLAINISCVDFYCIKNINNKSKKIIIFALWLAFIISVALFFISWQNTQNLFNNIYSNINDIKMILNQIK